jgi:site-specific DNA-methyltransferase (cytosine-N4-specific)
VSVYYEDATITLHHGDALDVLRTLPVGSVNCAVTSPPYYGLRDYGIPGQIGTEETPADYVQRLVEVFSEVRRVLADDGTLWLNLGDSYSSGSSGQSGMAKLGERYRGGGHSDAIAKQGRRGDPTMGPKNLMLIPHRVAFALQDDGWILRNAVVWTKPNAMPESVTDRLSTKYEMVFLFSKKPRYWFDLDPIRAAHVKVWTPGANGGHKRAGMDGNNIDIAGPHANGSNPGDVWNIATAPYPSAHFAVFPPELPRRCIVSGCKPGGTVLDPFHGSGTTGKVAVENGRKYVGIELNREYLDLSLQTRLTNGTLDFGSSA